jgi:hypothetical protein
MTSLQIVLIVAGVVLVAGVLAYNWWQERRVRRRIDAAFTARAPGDDVLLGRTRAAPAPAGDRVEPSLGGAAPPPRDDAAELEPASPSPSGAALISEADGFDPPVDVIRREAVPPATAVDEPPPMARADFLAPASAGPVPDPEIESIVTIQPVRPIGAGVLAAGLNARLGKPLRWFGRRGDGQPWQLLGADTRGEFAEVAACLLLADRTGAASAPLLDAFVRLASEVAASIPAAFVAPSPAAEASRAEALDRICADLDVQIGLTLIKTSPATMSGTRLRGVAEASGFRLAGGGRFEWVQEETGAVLYVLQNYRSEPFTADSLRMMSTPGTVVLLDVPRVADPARVFDQMKLAAKRMAQTLDATLVDDNRRPLDDPALAAIRQQVQATAAAMREVRIEPGSPRALALFGG